VPGQPIVVLDANVLYPVSLCDTLLRCAVAGLFIPAWSEEILREFTRNLVADGRVNSSRADRRALHMQAAFPEAMLDRYHHLIPLMECHEKDRHVLAAAVYGAAEIIVTQNLSDFTGPTLQAHGIKALHPDPFLCSLMEKDLDTVEQAITQQAAALVNPPMTIREVLAALAVHVPVFVERISTTLFTATE
jgi:predicted nucleic acid-binding protein